MSFSISSVGHALATGLSDAVKASKAVTAFIAKIDTPGNEATVEALTALVPGYGADGVVIERGVFAIAGEVAGVLGKFDDASVEKLVNAGLDKSVIEDFVALLKSAPSLFAGVVAVKKA